MTFNETILKNLKLSTHYLMGLREQDLKENLCFAYAYLFKNTYGGVYVSFKIKQGEKFFDVNKMWEHCFVKLNDKYYDFENPHGISNIKETLLNSDVDLADYVEIESSDDIQFLELWGFCLKKITWTIVYLK